MLFPGEWRNDVQGGPQTPPSTPPATPPSSSAPPSSQTGGRSGSAAQDVLQGLQKQAANDPILSDPRWGDADFQLGVCAGIKDGFLLGDDNGYMGTATPTSPTPTIPAPRSKWDIETQDALEGFNLGFPLGYADGVAHGMYTRQYILAGQNKNAQAAAAALNYKQAAETNYQAKLQKYCAPNIAQATTPDPSGTIACTSVTCATCQDQDAYMAANEAASAVTYDIEAQGEAEAADDEQQMGQTAEAANLRQAAQTSVQEAQKMAQAAKTEAADATEFTDEAEEAASEAESAAEDAQQEAES